MRFSLISDLGVGWPILNRARALRNSQTAPVAGRPRNYDAQELMDVWLHVRVGMARTGLSAFQFCKRRRFYWLEGGRLLPVEQASRETGRVAVNHLAHGETLRRRYQEAVAFLRAESVPYRRIRELGYYSQRFGSKSPTEEWWESELKAALARS